MAENKKSFVLYADLIHTVRKMPKAKAGDLFLTILSYVNDENPIVKDPMVDLIFEQIKQQLKRDLKKYEKTKEKKKSAGVKGAEARWNKESVMAKNGTAMAEMADAILPMAKMADNVNVNDNVNVIDKANQIEVYFSDLPNSSYLENICRVFFVPKEKMLGFIPEFRKFARVKYKDNEEFVDHFKFWVGKRLREDKPGTQSVVLPKPFPK